MNIKDGLITTERAGAAHFWRYFALPIFAPSFILLPTLTRKRSLFLTDEGELRDKLVYQMRHFDSLLR